MDQDLPERRVLPDGFGHHFFELAAASLDVEVDPDCFQTVPPGIFLEGLDLDFEGRLRASGGSHQRQHLVSRVGPPAPCRGLGDGRRVPPGPGAGRGWPALATRRWSSKTMRIRSGLLCGSIYWVLLVSMRFSVPKPLSQIRRSTLWLLQGLSPRPSLGGFGLRYYQEGVRIHCRPATPLRRSRDGILKPFRRHRFRRSRVGSFPVAAESGLSLCQTASLDDESH